MVNRRTHLWSVINRLRLRLTKGGCGEEPEDAGRVVLVHNHIFKNAGSTIDWALLQNFGSCFVDHRDDDDMRKGAPYLEEYLATHKHIRALSTHHLALPLPEVPDARLIMISMLRHPIERVTSVYSFERKQVHATTPGAIHARKLDLTNYVLWRMKPDVGATIRNFQVRKFLSSLKARQEVFSSDDLEQARATAASAAGLLGIVERFDECMVLFEENLRQVFPKISLSYVRQNVGQQNANSREDRIEKLRQEIGEDAFAVLEEKNRHDLQFYEWAEQLVDDRIGEIKDFNEKLRRFRSRCAALCGGASG